MAFESSLLQKWHQRTNHRHPEYFSKWPGIRCTKKRGLTLIKDRLCL